MARCFETVGVAGFLIVGCLFTIGVAAQTPPAQTPPPQKEVPKVKGVRAAPIASVEGKDNFSAYCAVCHGQTGKGDGPAAPAMKVAVPDLTTIAKRNNGKFNATHVEYIIRGTGKTSTPAHGVEDMPIWGEVFGGDDRSVSRLRIGNLVKSVESIQQTGADSPR
jgi:mono/diheme cytochrome c family protein